VGGLAIRDGALVEADGTPFVMRGVNVPHAWYRRRTTRSLRDIAATGANTVRLVIASGGRWPRTPAREVARLIALAGRLGMIAVLEVHDTTGYGAEPEAVHIGAVLPYWLDLADALRGREDRVLINIANEPTVDTPASVWSEGHRTAILALRAAGLRHTLVVDADDHGQDTSNTMRDGAADLFHSDPLRNVLFSVHMYQHYGQGGRIAAYLEHFRAAALPLIVGEFGPEHRGEPVDQETIFRLCDQWGVGYLGWSWSGNAGGAANLDIVQGFDAARLSPWGERLIGGPHGIRATSRPAGVFAQRRTRLGEWLSAGRLVRR
jgi:mannan endo-1,4-beta-mannosidase